MECTSSRASRGGSGVVGGASLIAEFRGDSGADAREDVAELLWLERSCLSCPPRPCRLERTDICQLRKTMFRRLHRPSVSVYYGHE